MPLYEYKCRSCSKTEDVRHGFKDEYDGKCAACGGDMARVFTPTGIVFKGSGFYLTDSRKAEAAGPGSASSSGSTPPPAASSESGPSSTPAAAPAATPAVTPAAAPATPSKSESAA